MNIAKYMAEEAATALVADLKKSIQDRQNRLNDEIVAMYESKLPGMVLSTFKEHPSYFQMCGEINLVSGTVVRRVYIDSYPFIKTGGRPSIEVARSFRECVDEESIAITKMREKAHKAYNTIVDTLLSLKTLKRVQNQFPEAYEILKGYEDKNETAIALPIKEIRELIKVK